MLTLGHDICDGVGDNLECRRAVNPAERDHFIQVIFVIPFNPKFQGIRRVHPQVPEGVGYINF